MTWDYYDIKKAKDSDLSDAQKKKAEEVAREIKAAFENIDLRLLNAISAKRYSSKDELLRDFMKNISKDSMKNIVEE